MEEDSGPKAPVTRLRRRLSVEQPEESKSPAPSTPTKRRTSRRTAKPELELIEENATSNTPQDKAKKTVTKDLLDTIEEKPLTPSRRSARIRSNTSIVSETTAVTDSPRAKRASRRLSQVGSDNEAPTTPARQTRRTRKDSTSSIDKVENQAAAKQSNAIPEPITEESESITSHTNDEKDESKTVRKSPRLLGKKERKSTSSEVENVSNQNTHVEDMNNSTNKLEPLTKDEKTELSTVKATNEVDSANETTVKKKDRLSMDSTNLIENISSKPNKRSGSLNKSTSTLETLNPKSKRSRTKSCTISTVLTADNNVFYSDNESSKKQVVNYVRSPLKLLNKSGSRDSILNKSKNKDNLLTKNEPVCNEKNNSEKSNSTDETNSNVRIDNSHNIFDKDPTGDMQITITMEDSDTNSGKLNRDEDDQCVPEVGHIMESSYKLDTFNTTKENKNISKDNTTEKPLINDSCEPMDVDETIPESLLIEGNEEDNTSVQSSRKSINEKSRRKSSIVQDFNDSGSQSKSTLVLSHIKDTSTSEINKSSKSPEKLNDNRILNISTVLNTTQENKPNKNVALCYSTSTPLQEKSNKRERSVSTSNIKPNTNNDSKLTKSKSRESESDGNFSESDDVKRRPNKQKKEESSASNSDDSDNESSNENSNLMDNEAEDAGDDYESGDSQDEDEREEALQNEIRDGGETLSTEDDISNDSDYEKDSFIVSSAEEDNELLEGTEDDLSMSDGELTMSKESKKKYNERKLKEQKRASREMYEARHQINVSKKQSISDTEKKTKKGRQRLSSSESDYEISKSSKATNKQGLDSSQDENEVNIKTPRRSKTPSQSICNESTTMDDEKEITISNQASNDCDPLSEHIKAEPKTPQNKNMSMAFIEAHDDSKESDNEGDNLDPLASTNVDDDSSMSSDNERIVQDYDSVLQGLNKTNKIKTGDISLNLETKIKNKEKNTIVDELNLTKVKTKTPKNKTENNKSVKTVVSNPSHDDDDESSSSDSALLHLLFSEESNNCEDPSNKTKKLDSSDEYISLKKNKDKPDIHDKPVNDTLMEVNSKTPSSDKKKKKRQSESSSCNELGTIDLLINQLNKTPSSGKKNKKRQQSETSLNEEIGPNDSAMNTSTSKTPTSGKKKKQMKLSESEPTEISSEVQFFIDTEGTRTENISISNKSLNRSKTSVSEKGNDDSDSDAPMEVSFKKEKNLTSSKIEDEALKVPATEDAPHEKSLNQSINESLGSSKKKKKKKNSLEPQTMEANDITDLSFNKSIAKTPECGKKKQKHSNIDTNDEIGNTSLDKSKIKTPKSDKKNKKLFEEPNVEIDVITDHNISHEKTPVSKKKQKRLSETSQNDDISTEQGKNQKRKRETSTIVQEEGKDSDEIEELNTSILNKKKKVKLTQQEENVKESLKKSKNKKRKEREDDNVERATKVFKENSIKEVQVSRLPTSLLEQLDEKPRKGSQAEPRPKKSKLTATTDFIVEETRTRRNKPSMYLEESIYLNEDDHESKKNRVKNVKPKVLPFVPSASTSISGFTTNFKVNVIPTDIKFIARSSNVANFKTDYLYNKKIKRNKTYELYKTSRNIKLSKF